MGLTFTTADGRTVELPADAVAGDLLAAIAPDAVAVEVDGRLLDVRAPLPAGGRAEAVHRDSPEALRVLRCTAAHVLAHAVKRLYPAAEPAAGKATADGFFYDFAVERPFAAEDLRALEAEMARLVEEDLPIERATCADAGSAIEALRERGGERFVRERLESRPRDEVVVVRQGSFADLCEGAHLRSTGEAGPHIKLLSSGAAYWLGDETRETLQRIYGTAWFDADALRRALARVEEARRRDHRTLGRDLKLFSFAEEAPGHVVWLPRGMVCYRAIEGLVREELHARGYREVRTPVLLDAAVWERSGHLTHYRENMYLLKGREDARSLGMKPMNCPGAAIVYRSEQRSYRDLPLRIAEFGLVHRNERSGVVSGLTRVRSFTQDDAHIFCAPEQVEDEVASLVAFVREVYERFGFDDVRMYFSTRPPSSCGSDAMWEAAEGAIRAVLHRFGGGFEVAFGAGAFYGPKIDFRVADSLKREWQLATIQLDFSLPEAFGLRYADRDGVEKHPVVIHRAILGSFERFFAILIEHFGGAFPLWLAPEQARVVPVTPERHEAAARAIEKRLVAAGLRATTDARDASVNAKVREAALEKVNYVLVVGDREVEAGKVAVRRRDGEQIGTMSVGTLVDALAREVRSRSLHPSLAPPIDAVRGREAPRARPKREATGTMRAVRLTGVGEARLLRDVPIPEPGPGEVRIRVLAAGICGTDKHLCAGDPTVVEKAKPPRTLGHEFCGEIDRVGDGVREDFAPGEYVTAEMHVVCGHCPQCRTGMGHVCENTVICGLHADGSFADYVVVPAQNVIRLDRNAVPLKVGAFLDALGNAVHCAQATRIAGRNVAVLGYGPIGAMAASVVEFMGASQVFVTEVHPYNLEHARAWARSVHGRHPRGLERVVVLDTSSREKREAALETIRERTDGCGVDAALEISGHPDAINDGLAMLRWGGDLVELGIGRENAVTLHNWNGDVVFKGRQVKGIIGRRMYDTWNQMLGLLQAGLDVEHIVTLEAALDDFDDAMAKFRRNETMKVVLYTTGER